MLLVSLICPALQHLELNFSLVISEVFGEFSHFESQNLSPGFQSFRCQQHEENKILGKLHEHNLTYSVRLYLKKLPGKVYAKQLMYEEALT